MWEKKYNRIWLWILLGALITIFSSTAWAQPLKAGQAKGTFTKDGKAIQITHAFAFVDQKDNRKPVLLLLADRQVPMESWKSEFDLMRYLNGNPLSGVCFWFDKSREVFRRDYYWSGRQTSTMGIFEVKLEGGAKSQNLIGKAWSTDDKLKLNVLFNASLK